ncbi:MAG: hypothetical protein ICV56_02375 [Nitrososphaeraceae archaeon]|nr:hypothetical protein [Nitrososphaeraceae archaeon]
MSESKCGNRHSKDYQEKILLSIQGQLVNYILDREKERSVMIEDKDVILTTSSAAVETMM